MISRISMIEAMISAEFPWRKEENQISQTGTALVPVGLVADPDRGDRMGRR
jgi:hypothetical protein